MRIVPLLLLLPALLSSCDSGRSTADGFLWGIVFTPGANGRTLEAQARDMSDAGANAAKFWLDWSRVQPTVLRFDESLVPSTTGALPTREAVRAAPRLIEAFAQPESSALREWVDWSYSDKLIGTLSRAGLAAVPLIADATTAPFLTADRARRTRIAPEEPPWKDTSVTDAIESGYEGIGRENYLGQVLLYTAAAARRYSRGSLAVGLWNTENELNWTYVHVLVAGWRKGNAWLDEGFLTDLMATLAEGIHLGNPAARVTMNLNISDPDWLADLRTYGPHMDVIGLGAYPNYLYGEPILSDLVGAAVGDARRAGLPASAGKPVMVLETGYPSGPPGRDWSPEYQAEYLRRAAGGACREGAEGFFYFKLDDEDLPRQDVQAVENYWGLVDASGNRKPSFHALTETIREVCPLP
ncbi:MAG: hypothetical protein HYY13_03760 [Nitrospirae bacterium]|nr:hypothetical protein [Nitrospirota bacterium]